ncbi:isocitrate lyase/phosphoenolpyruvate mutase family protein [Kitasatospora sp. NPDC051853]|uniref:isocitrate lyase/phosphoenolpyruvate mutase family protein n=1 Tax=Kitasatospora sp. NPDC051853 TaxID=3364058 RepID=UPI0037BD3EA8
MPTLLEKARAFRSLHVPGRPLVLPNAWDVASALLVARAGARAVATTSAGVAWSLGAADGGRLDRERGLAAVARIASAVDLPVTADIERGFAEEPEGVHRTVTGVLEAGAVGVNLEDGLRPVAEQAERIAAARAAADAAGIPLYLNARIDTHRLPPGGDRLDETVRRAHAYAAAGADGVFVLSALDAAELRSLVAASDVPVNVLIGPGTLTVPEYAAAGAARVSAGSSIAEAAYSLAERAARELLDAGTVGELDGQLDWAALNAVLLGEQPAA